MRRRFAIVTPWYGEAATGGAESLARDLGVRLAEQHDVTILTTCSYSFLTEWDENHYPAGTTTESAMTIKRFSVDRRDRPAFDALNRRLLDLPKAEWGRLRHGALETDAFIDQSINSGTLEGHLAREALQRYDHVLFVPYLYGVVVRGIEAYPGRAHLLPCLHDEAYARLPRIENVVHRASTVLANSAGEAELLLSLYGPGVLAKVHVIGSGVDFGTDDDGSLALPSNVVRPFVLYMGRRDITKNVDSLIAAYRRFRADAAQPPLSLVLAGPGTRSYDDPARGVVDLGFVTPGTKAALLESAVGLLQPSANESYSRVLMEAWLRRKPVAVNAACLATATAVREADGGYLAETEDDWVDVLRRLAGGDPQRLAAHGVAGERYARDRADWNNVLGRLMIAVGAERPERRHRPHHRRVDQYLTTLEYGDAISDYARAIQRRLVSRGFDSTIYAEHIGTRVADAAVRFDPRVAASADAIIYHHSIASSQTNYVVESRSIKVMVYHNITPAAFFAPFRPDFAALLETGRAQTAKLVDRFDRYIADSEFNADELRAMGAADVRAVPVIIDYSRFDISPDRNVLAQRSRTANVLFVGRVSPSKGILALIDVFEAYLCFDPGAHLTIVGRYDTRDAYYQAVVDAIRDRRLRRAVTLAGVVDEAALLAYYQTADIYLSLSEHEGFCVPVVEAMFFDVPVVALGTTAVPETVGAGGLLIEPGMDRFEIAGLMHAVADDRALRATILAAARERRQYYLPQAAQQRLDGLVDTLLPA